MYIMVNYGCVPAHWRPYSIRCSRTVATLTGLGRRQVLRARIHAQLRLVQHAAEFLAAAELTKSQHDARILPSVDRHRAIVSSFASQPFGSSWRGKVLGGHARRGDMRKSPAERRADQAIEYSSIRLAHRRCRGALVHSGASGSRGGDGCFRHFFGGARLQSHFL